MVFPDVIVLLEPTFELRFWVDFLKEALAAIAGAGVGAWLGARFAFRLSPFVQARNRAAE
jgi:hypothetical protein